jgi:hypothetical protein
VLMATAEVTPEPAAAGPPASTAACAVTRHGVPQLACETTNGGERLAAREVVRAVLVGDGPFAGL